ncbi:MAG: ABC transporter permease [Opitutaceae bacterium]
MSDLRLALRQLAKSPGFTTIAVLTLALGIGASAVVFSVVDRVLLRPLAYPQSERLVVIRETKLPQVPEFSVASGNYFDWREQAQGFEQLAAIRNTIYNLTGRGEPQRLTADRVTPNYFTTLRTRPLLGRDFTDEEAVAKAPVAILAHGFWLRQFGSRTDAIGASIQLNGQPFTIVGVMPENFRPGSRTEIFTPVDYADNKQNHGAHNMQVYGRLKDGVTIEQARSELAAVAKRLEQQYPTTNTGWSTLVTPMFDHAVGNVSQILYPLLGAVGFLLLIACANVANLQLARATARAKEISVRSALGATRGRLIRQLLSESVLLALLGGALGVLVAKWGMDALLAFAPDSLPRTAEIALDGRALGFACVVALVTGVGFGLVPAFQATRLNLNETLKDGGRGTSAGSSRARLRGALVVAEVALALVLLIGAGLLIRSFTRRLDISPGFQPQEALAANLSLPGKKYATPAQQTAFVEEALGRLAAIPGVQSAAVTTILPFSGDDMNLRFDISGRPPVSDSEIQSTLFYAITPDYLHAMGIRLIRGRAFTTADRADAPRVVLINEALARKFFPDQDPIGQRLRVTNAEAEIVGIVGDVQHFVLGDATSRPQTYEPFAQVSLNFLTFVVRAAPGGAGETKVGLAANLPAAIRAALYAVDKDQPIDNVRPLTDLVASSVSRQRFAMFVFAVFSGVALLLAAIGIYGVTAYAVTQRTNEIGIRMALGAQRGDVLRLIFAQGSRLIGLGLVCGVAGALALTRYLSSLLFNVSATDPLTFGAIAALLAAVAAIACLIPARRATKVDPMVALRSE